MASVTYREEFMHDMSKAVVGIQQIIPAEELLLSRDEPLVYRLQKMVMETLEFLHANPESMAIYKEYGLMIRLRLEPFRKS